MTDAVQSKARDEAAASYQLAEAPGAWPFLGHTVRALRDPLAFVRSLPSYGDLVKVKVGVLEGVVVCHPDLVVQVLRDDGVFVRGGAVAQQQTRAAVAPFSHREKEAHRAQRRTVVSKFHTAALPRYALPLHEEVNRALVSWQDGKVIDVRDEMAMVTSGWAFRTIFDRKLPDGLRRQIGRDVRTVFYCIPRHAIMPTVLTRLPIPLNRRYERARRRLWQTANGLIADQKAGLANDDNLVASLLKADLSDTTTTGHRPLSEREVHGNVLSFMFASFNTTSAVLAWALHALAQHPEHQDRLRAEIAEVVGDVVPPTFDVLPKLPLLNNIVKEALRLHTPTWISSRNVATDTVLGGHRIPAGTTILWSPYMMHHQAEIYPDPERYDPDRWTDPNNTARPSAGTYVPFATGPRMCIAENMGFTGVAFVLAGIFSKWRVEPVAGSLVVPDLASVLGPRNLRLRLRSLDGVSHNGEGRSR